MQVSESRRKKSDRWEKKRKTTQNNERNNANQEGKQNNKGIATKINRMTKKKTVNNDR